MTHDNFLDLHARTCARVETRLYRLLREALELHRWARGVRVVKVVARGGGRPAIASIARNDRP